MTNRGFLNMTQKQSVRVVSGSRFEGVEDIKSNVTSFLKRITKDFAECFQAWRRWMEKCTEVQGDYFKGNN